MTAKVIAVLGGSFDPVHNGHLALAHAAIECLGPEQLRIMPAKLPPHKAGYLTSEGDRLNMLALAIEGLAQCHIDRRELVRERTSYSVLSMRELRQEQGDQASLCFIMGWDSIRVLETWWHWRELFEYVNIAVAARPGFSDFSSGDVRKEFESRLVDIKKLSEHAAGKVAVLPMNEQNVASSEIRQALAQSQGNKNSLSSTELDSSTAVSAFIKKHVPAAVALYIEQHGLYC